MEAVGVMGVVGATMGTVRAPGAAGTRGVQWKVLVDVLAILAETRELWSSCKICRSYGSLLFLPIPTPILLQENLLLKLPQLLSCSCSSCSSRSFQSPHLP